MFKITKLKLTGWYLLILTVITVSFSSFVYPNVLRVTERALLSQRVRIEDRFRQFNTPPGAPMPFQHFDEETLSEIREKTLVTLVLINIIIIAGCGGLSYFLAGVTLKPIEDMLTKQKMFISNASHEIKTPLTIIKTNLEVALRDRNLSIKEAKAALQDAVEEIDKLNSFTNRLLSHSKYQNGFLAYKNEPVNLPAVINSVLEKANKLAKKDGTTILKNISSDRDIKVQGNKDGLEEAFTNLIENAIKYGKPKQHIEVTLLTEDNFANVSIKDSGVGIAQEDLPFIFEPFYQADKVRSKQKTPGFGLGLAISKEIIEAHGGSIKVESMIGKGSIFTVRLPIKNTVSSGFSQGI